VKAHLYDIKRYYSGEEYPKEDEFIVVSSDNEIRDSEAKRVFDWYVENSKTNLRESVLGSPQLVENNMIGELSSSRIDWEKVQRRQLKQRESRPRGIGCVFRGGSPESAGDLTKEEVFGLRESIEYFMKEHRIDEEPYLFVGSKWKQETRLRFGEISLFEACGIELASDIAQLHFLSEKCETTYINWCCPIYVV
jgi:hypothetical protein